MTLRAFAFNGLALHGYRAAPKASAFTRQTFLFFDIEIRRSAGDFTVTTAKHAQKLYRASIG
jgi:hypothetical protein